MHNRRCASEDRPLTRAAPSDCSFNSTSIKPEYQPDAVFTIPVVWHIIQRTDGTGNIPEELIHSQMEILNEDFEALAGTPGGGGTAGKIRFVLASTDPNGNSTTGINYYTNNGFFVDPGSGASPMKTALRWDTTQYFNIYTNDANGALGYATFPSESAGDIEDGVVLLHTSVGRDAPQGGIYNQGRTATHEVGHYLGLFHTFQGNCGSAGAPYTTGDLIADTVAHSGPDFECTAGASTCGGGSKPIENYMNYTNDTCMTRFSVEQTNRMRCSIINYRSELVDIDVGENQPPNANFTTTTSGLVASFTDASTDADGTIASRSWAFGDGGTSTQTNPSRTYAAAGTYTVTLTVTDNAGATDSHTASVTVTGGGGNQLQSGVPVPNLSGTRGAQREFFLDVPAGARSVTFRTSGGTGDVDLYIRRGAAPTTSTYDGRGFLSGNNETVQFTEPAAGRYFVMLHAYTTYSGATLVATITTGGGAFDQSTPLPAGAQGSEQRFTVDVPAGATNLRFDLTGTTGTTGDADVYVRRGSPPTTTAYDFRPFLVGNNETVTVASPQSGAWHVMVRGYTAYSNVTLRIRYNN